MPYITFPSVPLSTGRSVRDACTDPVTSAYVCAVDELLAGDTEISADEHARIQAAAEAWYEANPPAPEESAPVEPSLADQVADLRVQLAAVSAYAGVPVEVMASATAQTVAKG